MVIEIGPAPLHPEKLVEQTRTGGSGCVVTYVGLIRDNSHGRKVKSVEYRDLQGKARGELEEIAVEVRRCWAIENIGIAHRTGILAVGDINLVVAVASAHREEGFAACQFVIDRFKARLPTEKTELYLD
jgi:molybdopterin synthase catalytic subunit